MEEKEPKAVSYTRDKEGKVENYHLNDIANTVHSSTGGGGNADCYVAEPRVMQVGNIYEDTDNFKNRTMGRVYSDKGLSPTINCCGGGDREPKIVEPLCSVHPLSHAREMNQKSIKPISPALRATDYKAPHCVYEPTIGAMRGRNPDNPSERGRSNGHYRQMLELNENGTSNTLTSVQKDNVLIMPEATAKGYAEAYDGDSVNLAIPNSKTRRGRVGNQMANTLDTGCQQGVVANYRIRKLTPRECFRLMDVAESDIDKLLNAGISNSQLYKLAGNSICVGVLYHIIRKLFIEKENEHQQLTLF